MLRTASFDTQAGKQTYHDLGWFRIEKDTLFGKMPAKVVEARFWEPYTDTVIRYRERDLYVFEDSQVSVYTFKAENGDVAYGPFLVGLLKPAASDTELFSDRMIQLKYPLLGNRPWSIRPVVDPFPNGLDLPKEYLGLDTLEFHGRSFVCGMLVLHGIGETPIKTWISELGLLKAEIDYGAHPITDSSGDSVGAGHDYESYSLLELNVDSTVVPGYFGQYGNGPLPTTLDSL